MPSYSRTSDRRLSTARPELQKLFREVLRRGFDHAVIEGHRNRHDQHECFVSGTSKLDWPDGKHNAVPSDAVDARPYIPGIGYPKDHKYFYRFAGQVEAIASELGYLIRWGGDWDSDGNMDDQTFNDLFHFEFLGYA